MNRQELEQFFERLLTEPEDVPAGAPRSSARAALLAAVTGANGAREENGDVTPAQLAAYVSKTLDPAEADEFLAALLRSPAEIFELEAAQSFLDRVAEQKASAPADLMAEVLAEAKREQRRGTVPARPKWSGPHWLRDWRLAGGAIAAMVLAVVVVDRMREHSIDLLRGNLEASIAPAEPLTTADVFRNFPSQTEVYPNAQRNPVKIAAREPVSTFSVDVDTASYANVRRYLNEGSLPPEDAVRVEEMINYFDYHYAVPADRSVPFRPTIAVYPTPWNPNSQILHIGIKGFDLPKRERPKANLVFLIDTSGSMDEPEKLPLLQSAFSLLVEQLRPDDHVAVVAYAGSSGMLLEPTSGAEKDKILAVLDRLNGGGYTDGSEGIRQAYEIARKNFDKNAVNRVLLATDGDFNVGITDPKELETFIASERSSGVFLTVLGFGPGNYNDETMQKLAQAGNGVAAYIDTINEANKVFVEGIGGTLFTIAKDVKIQVEFNPARIAEYRLIGYETRALQTTDFNNDNVDAGDIGSGHSVTALYEITPVDSKSRLSDPLRYGTAPTVATTSSEFAFVKIRYKLPAEDESHLITRPVKDADVQLDFARVPADLRFAAVVAGAGQLMRKDPSVKSFSYDRAIALARESLGGDATGYRAEFIRLLGRASAAPALASLDSRNVVVVTPPAPATPAVAVTPHAVTEYDYPAVSIRLQEQGTVGIRFVVGTDGNVSACQVTTPNGKPRLDTAACTMATNHWKYRPATQDGNPVAQALEAEIIFSLK